MNASMISENCPRCLIYGLIIDLHVDLTQREVIYTCPGCGSQFTESDLQQIYEQKLSELNGENDET